MDPLFNIEDKVTEKKDSAVGPSVRYDGWFNSLSSIGTSRDKRQSSSFVADRFLDQDFLVSLYSSDGLVKTIIDLIPDLAFKSWGYIENDDSSVYSEGILARELNRLDAASVFSTASKWNRLQAGCLIFIGAVGAGKPETPLKFEKIKNIEFLRIIPKTDVLLYDSIFDKDPTSPTFGKILKYHVKIRVGSDYSEMYVHHTRCIPFFGIPVPSGTSSTSDLDTRYWGVSILQSMYADIRDYRVSLANVALLLQEGAISVYNFTDLDEILSSGNGEKLQTRISAIQMSKSVINAVLLGTDEKYSRETISFAGVSDVLDKLHEQISAITRIPVSKLWGTSASGLNSTGQSEESALNDQAIAEQNNITAEIQKFINMIASWKGLDPDGDYSWKWNNLVKLSDEEIENLKRLEAERYAATARELQLSISEGVISPEDAYEILYKDRLGDRSSLYFEELEPDPVDTNGGDPTKKKTAKGVDAGNS